MADTPTHFVTRRKDGNAFAEPRPWTTGQRSGGYGPGAVVEAFALVKIGEYTTGSAPIGAPVVTQPAPISVKQGETGSLNLAPFVSAGSGNYTYALEPGAPAGIGVTASVATYTINEQAFPEPLSFGVRVYNSGSDIYNTINVTLNIALSDVVWSTIDGRRDVKGLSVHHPPFQLNITGDWTVTTTINPADMATRPILLLDAETTIGSAVNGDELEVNKSPLFFSIFEPVTLNEQWWDVTVPGSGVPLGGDETYSVEQTNETRYLSYASAATDARGNTRYSFGPVVEIPALVSDGSLPVDILTVESGTASINNVTLQSGETWTNLRGGFTRNTRNMVSNGGGSVTRRGAANRGPVQRAITTVIQGAVSQTSFGAGPAVRIQPDGSCYYLASRGTGDVVVRKLVFGGDGSSTFTTLHVVNRPDPAWNAADLFAVKELFVDASNNLYFKIGASPLIGPITDTTGSPLLDGGVGIAGASAASSTNAPWPTTFDTRNN